MAAALLRVGAHVAQVEVEVEAGAAATLFELDFDAGYSCS
jgi:hypothetical protein